MKRLVFSIAIIILQTHFVMAQNSMPVTDAMPASMNGLVMGYNVKNVQEKEVGDKGNFSRYALHFYITNNGSEAKIILYKQGLNIGGNVSDQLVQFNCLNATGARLTSKFATISAVPCNVLAQVEDKDCNGKTSTSKRFVQIGYWIKAGQTIGADAVVIVPLNEQPKVEAVFLANQLQPMASAPGELNNNMGPTFVRLQNATDHSYVNIETGNVRSTTINVEWWSAQWQVLPVPGSNYVNIKNRWKENYLNVSLGNLGLSNNFDGDGSKWILEPGSSPGVFHLRNVATGTYLCIASDQLKLANNFNNVNTANWLFEKL